MKPEQYNSTQKLVPRKFLPRLFRVIFIEFIVSSSKAASEFFCPQIMNYEVERDLNKAFVNLTLISVFKGL